MLDTESQANQHQPIGSLQLDVWVSLQCFSSVVGPNGSGKSNVIDAMLFVFGKRAKQVRQRCLNLSQLPLSAFHDVCY